MKKVSESITWEDGEWWYQQPSGIRQRAKIKACETCGDQFATYPTGETRFCSPECWRRPCKRCGKIFRPETKRQEYCSLTCKRGTGICENCGKSYVYSHHGAKRFCSKECFYEKTVPVGSVISDPSGYTVTKVPPNTPGSKVNKSTRTRWMWTHRYVMQQMLGRPLTEDEHVHHRDGRRDNNNPENLELLERGRQFPGQRVVDLVESAIKTAKLQPELLRLAGYELHRIKKTEN